MENEIRSESDSQEYNLSTFYDLSQIYLSTFYDLSRMSELNDEEVDLKIMEETKKSVHELEKDLSDIAYIWTKLAEHIEEQGDNLEQVDKSIQTTEENIEMGNEHIHMAGEYIKNKFILIRDISIIASGGILGSAGLLAGPIIGLGTIVAGLSAAGAAVAGIHKLDKI
jgi:hypothetical protein